MSRSKTRLVLQYVMILIMILSCTIQVSAINRFSHKIKALSESVFDDITGTPGDYAYDIRNITTDQDGFVVDFSKWNQPIISYDKALASAEVFLESNIEQVLLNNLSVIISAVRNDLPMWIIGFKGKYLEVKVGLNAFSGNPILLEIPYVDFQGAGIVEKNDWITKEYVETKSSKFLEDNGFSVPIDSRYMGSEQVVILYGDDDYYCIFEQIIGGLRVRSFPISNPIPDMGIVIQVDSYTGMVVGFRYIWFLLDEISNQNLISEDNAIESARQNIEDGENASIISCETLVSMVQRENITYQLRMVWLVEMDIPHEQGFSIWSITFIDAISGEYLGSDFTRGPDVGISGLFVIKSIILLLFPIIIITGLALSVGLFVRYKFENEFSFLV
jgi:hypothetical protein